MVRCTLATDEELVATLESIGPASLASLRQALRRRWSPRDWRFVRVTMVDVPEAKLARNPDAYLREPVEIWLNEDETRSDYTVFAASYGEPEDGLPNTSHVETLLAPFLTRHGATATARVDDDESDFGSRYQLGIDIKMPVAGRTVRDAFELGKGVLALLDAVDNGGLNREQSINLLHGGRVDVLLGQPRNRLARLQASRLCEDRPRNVRVGKGCGGVRKCQRGYSRPRGRDE